MRPAPGQDARVILPRRRRTNPVPLAEVRWSVPDGYLPTHNQRFSLPLTGNLAFDLVNNRTKRIFGDRTGLAAARNEAPYLLQRYKRDTDELMADLSVPVKVKGKHWGCVRIGYRQTEKP